MKKTKKNYEKHLNELYNDIYSLEDAVEHLDYLGSRKVVENAHSRRELGSLMKRKDPMGFNVGFYEWR